MPKRRLYIGCALTNAPQTFRDEVVAFKAALVAANPEIEILEFFGLGAAPSPE